MTMPSTPGTPDLSLPSSTPPPASSETPPAAPAPFDWSKAGLEQDHLNFVTERQWKNPGDLITSYRHAETAVGVPPERLIKLPAPRDAGDPKVWEPIWNKLGRPETAEKYVIPVPEGDKGEFASAMKPVLHKAGITQSQATILSTELNAMTVANQKAQQAELEAANLKDVTALKQAWGTEYDNRAKLVDRAAEQFGMTQDHLDAMKVVMGPKAAMEFLYNIGSKIAVEDRTVPGMGNQQTGFGLTPEAARAKIAEYKQKGSGMSKLLTSEDAKTRMEARAEMDRLYKLAEPGETPVAMTSGGR